MDLDRTRSDTLLPLDVMMTCMMMMLYYETVALYALPIYLLMYFCLVEFMFCIPVVENPAATRVRVS